MRTTLSSSYDAVVAGSGPGGAAAARALARAGWRVLLAEQGGAEPLQGKLVQMARMAAVPGKGAFLHSDASLLVQGVTLGGSTAVNFATAAAPPLARFAALGIDLAPALAALRAELPIGPLPDELIGPMAARIAAAARASGLNWQKLDKMIRPALCRSGCWRCAYGCPFGAKWSARDLVEQACAQGATLAAQCRVERVLLEDGRAAGVELLRGGERMVIKAPVVIVAGGGIGSPRLLHRSALAGPRAPFFSDPVVAVAGAVDGIDGGAEVPMAAGLHLPDEGITLADMTLPGPMYQAFALQAGRLDRVGAHRRSLTIMVKIGDRIGGAVGPRWVDKRLHAHDRARLARGTAMARAILAGAGARKLFQTHHFAAHPGGSVPIGAGVDRHLQTAAPGVYVCDASVLPGPWGLPPTLTLLCLGERLGGYLAAQA